MCTSPSIHMSETYKRWCTSSRRCRETSSGSERDDINHQHRRVVVFERAVRYSRLFRNCILPVIIYFLFTWINLLMKCVRLCSSGLVVVSEPEREKWRCRHSDQLFVHDSFMCRCSKGSTASLVRTSWQATATNELTRQVAGELGLLNRQPAQ